ncbi:DUF6412 domain-containing protein [Dactylosporangium sp. NPDC051485]|uniref:DUF6412 domain-containing protein n=1 Tax=Dactylosporangium sp. NPDC051485 TaxID=3154846 RepID=UPI00341BCF50
MSWSMTTLFAAWMSVATPADLVAVATAVLTALAVVLAARLVAGAPATPALVRAVPARARAARGQTIRSADPDAAGRPRPRAPGI